MDSKQQAQLRCRQIDAFNAELETLEKEAVLALDSEQKAAISRYHYSLIKSLSQQYDIDANAYDHQLTIGMRIASFFGALALAASLFFLFYRFWGELATPIQVMILVSSPLSALGLTCALLEKERSGYFAKIAALITLACFVLNLSMLGQIFNLSPSPNAFILWSICALGLAYLTRTRIMLTFAILLFAAFLSARMGNWSGLYWLSFGDRPENFFLPALLIFAAGHWQQKHVENFAATYRVFGLLLLLMPILALAHWAYGSYLPFEHSLTEGIYQIIGFALSALIIGYGIRRNWSDTVNTGTVFFVIFLYTKLFDWWWDWFPKYLFFLVIALSAILILVIFKRLRNAMKTEHQGEQYVA